MMQQVPFKTRLKAWWEGYDSPQSDSGRKPAKKPTRPRAYRRCAFPPRIEIQHMLFGEGRGWPLPADPMADLFDPVHLPNNAHALLLGTETGAPAFAINQLEPEKLSLMEPDSDWCEAALTLSRAEYEASRMHFGPVNMARLELVENTYDLFVSRLVLHHLEDRERFYTKLERGMRREGRLVLVQFTVSQMDQARDVSASLTSTLSPTPAYLTTVDDEQRLMTEAGIRVDVVEDISDDVHERLSDTFAQWRDLLDTIQGYDRQPELLEALLHQVEHWQSVMTSLQSGALQVTRFQAAKRGNELF